MPASFVNVVAVGSLDTVSKMRRITLGTRKFPRIGSSSVAIVDL